VTERAVAPDASEPGEAAGEDRSVSELKERLEEFLLSEIEIGSFPGITYAIGDSKGIVLEGARGHAVLKPGKIAAARDTIWDVASLTKPLVTSTLVLQAAAAGALSLSDRADRFIPELRQNEKRILTVIDLLTHRGGFQAWYPLYTNGTGDEAYLEALIHRPLRYRPGTREIYSCLGFVMLHQLVERACSRSVEDMAQEQIFDRLGLQSSMFHPPDLLKYRIAATEWGNANERQMVLRRGLSFEQFRNYMIWGEVNDGNAYYMGGIAGNAGLFSSAADTFEITRAYLDGSDRLLPQDLVRQSRMNYTMGLEENRGLGWQLQTPRPDHPTSMLSEGTFGHTGFTGTSVYADPDRDLIMVILTNRLHPTCKPLNTQYIRKKFHSIVVDWWDR
jgi:serine-type D-Ala-D-Ala carboxypeptidase